MEQFYNLLLAGAATGSLTVTAILINLVLALVFGLFIQMIYARTHRGGVSSSFLLTVLLVTVIAAAAMMIINNNLVVAFGLLGAFSIIRFRTVLKDTADITFIFLSLVAGMGVGTGNYRIVFFTLLLVACIMIFVRFFWNRMENMDKYILIISYSGRSPEPHETFQTFLSSAKLLEASSRARRPAGELHYEVVFKKSTRTESFLQTMRKFASVTNVRLLPSSTQVSY